FRLQTMKLIVLITFVVIMCAAADKETVLTSSCDGKQYKVKNFPPGCKPVSFLAVTLDDDFIQKELNN
ncbi:hypothetical protein BgiBS90_005689, partial [Biomphalaria glabrata]